MSTVDCGLLVVTDVTVAPCRLPRLHPRGSATETGCWQVGCGRLVRVIEQQQFSALFCPACHLLCELDDGFDMQNYDGGLA